MGADFRFGLCVFTPVYAMGLEKVAPGPKLHENSRICRITHAENQIIYYAIVEQKDPVVSIIFMF